MADIFSRLAFQATNSAVGKLAGSLGAGTLKFASTARNLLSGNFEGAGNSLLDNIFGASSSYGGGNQVLAGSTWAAMYQQYQEAQSVIRERSNLWHILIEPVGRLAPPSRLNMLAQEVSYNGVQLGYDTKKIGSGFTQAPTGRDPCTLSITTLDSDGEIKQWMENLQSLHAHPDGTFGLMSDYCNKFTITHGAWEEGRGYSRTWVLAPVDCQVSLNRTVEEFSTVTLTFTEAEAFGAL